MRSCLVVLIALLCACGKHGTTPAVAVVATGGDSVSRADDAKHLNLYIWADYLAPDTLSNFESRTGIKVSVSFFDTNETLETKVLTGSSGFDVVMPSAPYMQRQIAAGAYQPLDKARLPNLSHMDKALMAAAAQYDPGNRYGIIYIRGSEGIGYDQDAVARRLPGVAPDSWSLVFDPAKAAKLADCGIQIMDNPAGVLRLVLAYLHRDPNAPSEADLEAAQSTLLAVRHYVRAIDSFNSTNALANGDVCVLVGYNGDVSLARARALEQKRNLRLGFITPKEGAIQWFDMMAIPKDAPHPQAAHAFIDYVMEPAVMAAISNSMKYANANADATALVDKGVTADPVIYPGPEESRRLFVQLADTPERARALTRIWQRFKTGQ